MSVYGMMRTGVSGMNGQANRLSSIADNVANSATTGYKRSDVQFSTLVIPNNYRSYQSGGINSHARHMISQQGTARPTHELGDAMINGSGFFQVEDSGGRKFLTRAGSFRPDKDGYLQNAQGYYLLDEKGQKLKIDSNEKLESEVTTKIDMSMNLKATDTAHPLNPRPSSKVNVSGNINKDTPIMPTLGINPSIQLDKTASTITLPFDPDNAATYNEKSSVTVKDGQGRDVILDVYLSKTAPDSWTMNIQKLMPDGSHQQVLQNEPLNFDTAGNLIGAPANLSLNIPNEDGNTFTLDFNLGANVTQSGSSSSVKLTSDRRFDPDNRATYHEKTTQTVYDKNGNAINIDTYFTKKDDNTWEVNVYGQDISTNPPGYIRLSGSQIVHFNESGGMIDSNSGMVLTIPDATGNDFTVQMSWGGLLTQKELASDLSSNIDGLNPNDPNSYNRKQTVTVYDPYGQAIQLETFFTKTGPNEWQMSVYRMHDSTKPATYQLLTKEYPITFDANGKPTNPLGLANPSIAIPDSTGSGVFNVDLNLQNMMTQTGADYIASLRSNGHPEGYYQNFTIGTGGEVMVNYTNGVIMEKGRFKLGSVISPDELTVLSGTVFEVNEKSGELVTGYPGEDGFGSIMSGVLEESNVEMGDELALMIQAQRDYTANSKVFQTGDEVFQVITNLRR